jgi:hypothetical protein
MSHVDLNVSSTSNPHCELHPSYAVGCAACARARAAFQPYQVAGKPAAPSRSFQNSGSLIVSAPTLSRAEVVEVVVAETAAESLVDLVIGALFR